MDQKEQEMAPITRFMSAVNEMKAMRFSEDITTRVLRKLLVVYDNKWAFIEEDYHHVLVDAILDYLNNQVEEERKRKDTHLFNNFEPPLKKLNSVRPENRALLLGGCSQALLSDTKLQTLELEDVKIQKLSQSLTRRRIVHDDLDLSRLCIRGKQNEHNLPQTRSREGDVNVPKLVSHQTLSKEKRKENVSSAQAYPMQDTTGVSHCHPRGNELESNSLSRHVQRKDKPKEPISYQNTFKENEVVSRRVSTGLSLKGHSRIQYKALTRQQSEPSISDEPQLEIPITTISKLNQYPLKNKDGEDGGDGISSTGHNTGLRVELTNSSENYISNIEIASSPLGEVKISLSCSPSEGCPVFHMPSLDAVLRLAGDRCHKSHQIINTKFSMVKLMEELCHQFIALTSNLTIEKSVTRAGHFLKQSNLHAVIGSEGSYQARYDLKASSSNGLRDGLIDDHIMRSNKKATKCNGGGNKKRDQMALSHQVLIV